MRVLVASTGGAGHFNPLVPFAEAADEVLVVVPPELEATVAAAGLPYRIGGQPPPDELARIWDRVPVVSRDEAAVLVNREVFGRLCTAAMLPALERACDEWRPDLVVREPCEYSSAVAAERRGITHAQVAISLAEVEAASLDLAGPVLEPYGDGIVERLRASPYLTRFPASLDPSPFLATHRFSEGGAVRRGSLPDWWGGSDAPLVYATFGSVTGGLPIAAAAYRATLDAVDGVPARVLLTVGRATDVHALGTIPANVHVEAWVPQEDVLASAALFVCHGGSGTTFGALAAGVPLVLVPLFADQLTNARRVAAAGAALVIESDEDVMRTVAPEDAPRIRAAIETALAGASLRRAAERIAGEMRAAPGPGELLARLAPR